jgi:hypothetical protein
MLTLMTVENEAALKSQGTFKVRLKRCCDEVSLWVRVTSGWKVNIPLKTRATQQRTCKASKKRHRIAKSKKTANQGSWRVVSSIRFKVGEFERKGSVCASKLGLLPEQH